MQLFLGILLLVMAIFLTVAVLMQSGKSKRLSGTIAGGAETFFGKTKGRTIDSMLSKITTVVAILFVLVVIVVYVAFGSTYEAPEIIYTPVTDNAETPNEAPESSDATEGVETPEESETPVEDDSSEETPDAPVETPVENDTTVE